MVDTITRRLDDQCSRGPRGVVDQSKAPTRAAISPTGDTPGYSELSGKGIEERQHPVRAQDLTTRVPGPRYLTPRLPDWFQAYPKIAALRTPATGFPCPAPCAITRRNEAQIHRTRRRDKTSERAAGRAVRE